jgi:DNA-binding NarL/FixJ family response regulator
VAQRRTLLSQLAAMLATTGHLHESRAVLYRVVDLLPPGEPPTAITQLIARIELGLGRGEEAQALLLDLLSATDPTTRQAAELRLGLAETHLMLDEWPAAADEAATARRLGHALQDGALAFAATALSAQVAQVRGDMREAHVRVDEAVRILDRLPDADTNPAVLDALLNLVIAELASERYTDSLRHGERALRACRATGQSQLFAGFLFAKATAQLLQGRLEEARQDAENAVELALLLDNDQWITVTAAMHCWALMLRGEIDAALAAGVLAMSAAARAPHSLHAWLASACYGDALIAAGQPERARDLLLSLGGPAMTKAPPSVRPRWQRVLVEAELATGRIEHAAAIVELNAAGGEQVGVGSRVGEGHFARAFVLIARGEADEALEAARRAADSFDRAGIPVDAARARMLAGRALALAGEPQAAARELATAHNALQRCGAVVLAAEAAATLRAVDPIPAGAAQLTRRQRQVARLVAQGRTNRQIGAELHLSERTVEKHLEHMYAKLGVSSRAAIAAAVTRLDVEQQTAERP